MANTYTNSLENSYKNDDVFASQIHANECQTLVEFGNTGILSVKSSTFDYFEGNSEVEVQRHFDKAFFLPMADSRQIEPFPLPMRERKLPQSFWRQDLTSAAHFRHPMTLNVNHHNGTHNIYTTATVIGHNLVPHQSEYTGALNIVQTPESSFISYTKLPASVLTATAQNVKLTHAQMNDRPRCSLGDATALYYAYGPRAGHGFNPRYNFMLVQPDVKPDLPLVHGQPRRNGGKKG